MATLQGAKGKTTAKCESCVYLKHPAVCLLFIWLEENVFAISQPHCLSSLVALSVDQVRA
jgi:hypothetical protein